MRNLHTLAPADAPSKSKELLDDIIGRHGSAGDMVGLVTLNMLTGAFSLVAGIQPHTEVTANNAPPPR
ncbi:hypothetical protein [Actinomadura sp. 3N407]|uniref:hypothetical protein n=1 Tax=Actinomadura sp. 3N407 TaxID=3457423 RepID=UPI003FCD45B8